MCAQKKGFRTAYKIRITASNLHIHHGSLDGFKEAFRRQTAAMNDGVPIPLIIDGISELPALNLNVACADSQVAILGDTYVAKQFFDIKRLGTTSNIDTFTWEQEGNAFVCNKAWTQQHVYDLLDKAVKLHMRSKNVTITKT